MMSFWIGAGVSLAVIVSAVWYLYFKPEPEPVNTDFVIDYRMEEEYDSKSE